MVSECVERYWNLLRREDWPQLSDREKVALINRNQCGVM